MDIEQHPTAAAASIRAAVRTGAIGGNTAGMASGCVQVNIAIVPAGAAADFTRFCELNPRACPLLARSAPGDPALPVLGEGIDIRTDLPRYRIFRHGALAAEASDIRDLWRDDFVTFAIGCSFTFEHALLQAGVTLRHVVQGRNVAMYRTDRESVPAGPFGGRMVVSMRPFAPADVARASAISGRFPRMHGAPIHAGDPRALGIVDLAQPDYGEAVDVLPDEVPLFWACGVTSQAALQSARLPLFIAHAPGCMLITDLPHDAMAD